MDDGARDPRTTLFTAARNDEFAGPLPGADRPAFSYLALGGLRGWADEDDNGRVTAGELHTYVRTALQALVRDRRQGLPPGPVVLESPDPLGELVCLSTCGVVEGRKAVPRLCG